MIPDPWQPVFHSGEDAGLVQLTAALPVNNLLSKPNLLKKDTVI